MILVEPQYLPSVNYFNNIVNGEILFDTNSDYVNQYAFNQSRISNDVKSFDIKVPIIKYGTGFKLKDIKIDNTKNWINSHTQSIQSSYGKYPYFLFYNDEIINVLKRRHNYLIDLNYDLLTHLLKILNYDNKIRIIEDDNSKIIDLRSRKIQFPNQQSNDINRIRDDFFLGKNFDYSYSVIDLLFLRGPESGFLIRNFNKKN
tara:strand:- start:526 stop:1131 length:606 start_codon:yes stop_codon:yes gene_type:complete